MTIPRDPDRMIRAFLDEGAERLPDAVYDVVRAEIDTKRQRAPIGPWRVPIMNKLVPVGVGIAAVVAVVVIGSQVVRPAEPSGVAGQPTPSPTVSPTTAPSAAPTPTATPTATLVGGLPLMPGVGPVAAGTYALSDGVSWIRLTVPDGWIAEEDGRLLRKAGDADGPWFNLFLPDINVFADACLHDGEPDATGPTAEDLVSALEAQAGTDASAPEPVDIDGGTGVRLTLAVPADFDFAACPDQGLKVWQAKASGNYLAFGADGPGATASLSIVTAPTGRIVYAISSVPATPLAVRTELEDIVNSIAVLPAP